MHDQPRRTSRRTPAKVYRRRRIVVFSVVGLLLATVLYVMGSLVAPIPATAADLARHSASIVQPAAALAWPSGAAAITAPDYPGATATHGTTGSVPIASMTKTVTALVILDKKPVGSGAEGPSIAFTQKDVDIWHEVVADGGSWAPVQAGTSMTEKQALTAMLLPSANNYAISLADWAYGSSGAFVKAANAWLAERKFTGTHLVSPDGLDPGNVSTTADLIGIGKLVLKDPLLSAIVSQKSATLPGAGAQDNTNSLLGFDGIDGIKTGNTDQAGYCLLFSADVTVGTSKVRVIGAVLGAADHDHLWAGVKSLLASMQAGFHQVDASKAGQAYGTYTTPWGAKAALVSTATKSFVVWSNTPIAVAVKTHPVQSGRKGDVVGQVSFTLNGTTQRAPLALTKDLPDPGFLWRLVHPGGFGT
ncbi:MAG TPA: D-alanyl-D-alanine carboxypeptidase [Leifsonia sp.]